MKNEQNAQLVIALRETAKMWREQNRPIPTMQVRCDLAFETIANRFEELEQELEAAKKWPSGIPTCELVKELEQRDGVNVSTVFPYQDAQIKVNGPAVVLVVVD